MGVYAHSHIPWTRTCVSVSACKCACEYICIYLWPCMKVAQSPEIYPTFILALCSCLWDILLHEPNIEFYSGMTCNFASSTNMFVFNRSKTPWSSTLQIGTETWTIQRLNSNHHEGVLSFRVSEPHIIPSSLSPSISLVSCATTITSSVRTLFPSPSPPIAILFPFPPRVTPPSPSATLADSACVRKDVSFAKWESNGRLFLLWILSR